MSESNETAAAATTIEDQNDRITSLQELLGEDVVLLPIPGGEKRPQLKKWQETTVKSMEDADYLSRLRKSGNTGVLLGDPSNGLCAIDIDKDSQVEPFLDLNPALRQTLRTRGARGEQIWVRTTDYPALTKLKTQDDGAWGEWRSTGGQSVISGIHPDGPRYRFIHEAPPVTIPFNEIVWPENLQLPWVTSVFDDLVAKFGQPYLESESGAINLNQRFFLEKFKLERHVLFDPAPREFYLYDEDVGIWRQASAETIKRLFLEDITAVAQETGLARMHHLCTDATGNNFVGLLKNFVERPDAFAQRRNIIHVKNGVISFDNAVVRLNSADAEWYSRNICPYEIDPAAECPRFLNELLGPALSEDDILLLQKWCGGVLTGFNEAQRLLIITGTAGGGKSSLMTVLEGVIGQVNVAQLRTELLGNSFELYAFAGKTLLTGKDVSADFLSKRDASKLKALVGGDLMHAEKKGCNQRIPIRGEFNVGITCNADLNVRLEGDVDAWRRRLLIVKYDRAPVAKRIPGFAEQLLETEGCGILRWMVEGAIMLKGDLAKKGDFILSATQQQRIEQLLEQSESVRIFVREGIVSERLATVTIAQIKEAYFEFCEVRGWQPVGSKELGSQLQRFMLEIHKASQRGDIIHFGKQQRGYKHIQIVGEVEQ